ARRLRLRRYAFDEPRSEPTPPPPLEGKGKGRGVCMTGKAVHGPRVVSGETGGSRRHPGLPWFILLRSKRAYRPSTSSGRTELSKIPLNHLQPGRGNLGEAPAGAAVADKGRRRKPDRVDDNAHRSPGEVRDKGTRDGRKRPVERAARGARRRRFRDQRDAHIGELARAAIILGQHQTRRRELEQRADLQRQRKRRLRSQEPRLHAVTKKPILALAIGTRRRERQADDEIGNLAPRRRERGRERRPLADERGGVQTAAGGDIHVVARRDVVMRGYRLDRRHESVAGRLRFRTASIGLPQRNTESV